MFKLDGELYQLFLNGSCLTITLFFFRIFLIHFALISLLPLCLDREGH